MVPRERERMQRKDELRRQVSDDVAEGLVLGVGGDLPVCNERDDCPVTGRAEYQSWHGLCMAEVSCKDVQRRCWLADKQLVSDVIMSDVTSMTDVVYAFAMKFA